MGDDDPADAGAMPKECITTINGFICLLTSHRKPSQVSAITNRLASIEACSYGPGLLYRDEEAAAFAIASDSGDELDSDGGGGGGGAFGSAGGGNGGRGTIAAEEGASHLVLEITEELK